MEDFEKLGSFYLGREYDLATAKLRDELVMYDAKDLTTHAVCVGMTGSGKTGLCLSLLEEAAIDGIPAICIDPKGDLGNLLLSFPKLDAADFQPWVDPADAARKGITVEELAQKTAEQWKNGLAQWREDGDRIQRFRDAVDITIYTPGSSAGVPLTVLRSFAAPPPSIRDDHDAMRERVLAATSGLLALVGVDADPVRSVEHILIANIFDTAWRAGQDLSIEGLIRSIQKPPFDKVGVVDLESFYPEKDRFALSMQLNNLVASPSFASWMRGEALDIKRLFHTAEGKPRLTILSIAHLSDSERMFFVTILLNEVIAWMRAQSGTSSLRGILYMDEVFGYFPPTANPPTKTPMLTLMKQARAFGLGVVLATQNPVDLDYKGLSNAGTWFLGRLQTERDKARVLEGLEGASAAAGASFNRQQMEQTLAGLGNRIFLLNNVHEDKPVVFQSRWALSYLRGPVTRDQIAMLMADKKAALPARTETKSGPSAAGKPALREIAGLSVGERPILPPGTKELFVPRRGELSEGTTLVYQPRLLGLAKVHFVDAKSNSDEWESVVVETPVAPDSIAPQVWDEASVDPHEMAESKYESAPENGARFVSLPGELIKAKTFSTLGTKLKDFLYRNHRLKLMRVPELKFFSIAGESEGDFKARLAVRLREIRDAETQDLRLSYVPKAKQLEERLRKAEAKVEQEKAEATSRTVESVISFGASILGAFVGRKTMSSQNISKIGTSIRSAQRTMKARNDIGIAEDSVEAVQQAMGEVDQELSAKIDELKNKYNIDSVKTEALDLTPRKTDLSVISVVVVWAPYFAMADGKLEEAF